MRHIAPLLAFLACSACATPHGNRGTAALDAFPEKATAAIPSVTVSDIEAEILDTNEELERPEEHRPSGPPSSHPPRHEIPLEINRNVRKWVRYFSQNDQERFQRFLARGNPHKKLITDILRAHGVPSELYYLAMIESGYVNHARSGAGAVGIWQFIAETGKRYGLAQNHDMDERRDLIRSTEAAAKYLRNLHDVFQSWYLAMAGYNAGEGRIMRAVMRGGTRDFWELVEKKALPPETRDYVPKFLAAAIIGRNPSKYGFDEPKPVSAPKPGAVIVPGGVRLAWISNTAQVPLKGLRSLNPHLLRGITPRSRDGYSLWVPSGTEAAVARATASWAKRQSALAERPRRKLASAKNAELRRVIHVVRRGEALERIAKHYRIPLARIKRLNRLRSAKIQIGQKLVILARTR
jgi:membrane-bound lytic murein transglycosylase D